MSLTPWNRQEEWYQAMIDAAGAGGLPSVTSQDAGKVLSVNSNGEWDAESNLFIVTVTLSPSYTNVADKTYNEIIAALEAGKTVVCDRINERYSFSGIITGGTICFSLDNGQQNQRITISSTNSVSVAHDKYLPSITSSDAGKVLTANDSGVWVASKRKEGFRDSPFVQVIPISISETMEFSTTITPQDIHEGYTYNDIDYPPYDQSIETRAVLTGVSTIPYALYPVDYTSDGIELQTAILPMDSLGLTDLVGIFSLENVGYINPYRIDLKVWATGTGTT